MFSSRLLRQTNRAIFESRGSLLRPVLDLHRSTQARADPLARLFTAVGWSLFAVTYAIVANWLYEGHLDLWHGTYGVEDDEDDD